MKHLAVINEFIKRIISEDLAQPSKHLIEHRRVISLRKRVIDVGMDVCSRDEQQRIIWSVNSLSWIIRSAHNHPCYRYNKRWENNLLTKRKTRRAQLNKTNKPLKYRITLWLSPPQNWKNFGHLHFSFF